MLEHKKGMNPNSGEEMEQRNMNSGKKSKVQKRKGGNLWVRGTCLACLMGMSLQLSFNVQGSTIEFFDTYAEVGAGIYTDKWAATFAQKALSQGLIHSSYPRDLREHITREQFATLMVATYERFTGRAAEYSSSVIFTDTDNIMVKKAYRMGFVTGRTTEEFDPEGLITREEAAVMICKVLQTVNSSAFSQHMSVYELLQSPRVPDALKHYMIQFMYYIELAPEFDEELPWYGPEYAYAFLPAIYRLMVENNKYIYQDHSTIADWATESVYLNYNFEIMKGDDDGNFNPQDFIDIQSSLVLAVQILGE